MPNLTVKLRWKVITVFDSAPPISQENILFNLSPNTGVYSQYSIPLLHGYVPYVLSPTMTYHQVIRNLLRKRYRIEVAEKKFPYKIFVPDLNTETTLNIHIRLFPPNILSLTVKLSGFQSPLDVARLIDYQRLDHLRPVNDIVQWTIGLVETLNHKSFNLTQPLRFRPSVHLEGVCSADKFKSHIIRHLPMYVGILIGNYDYELMEDQIPAMVLEKNREHNVKSSQETLLIDKQGILYLTPHREKQRNRRTPKFSRTYDLYEIALVYSDFMRNYLSYRLCNEDFYDFILYKIRPWIENSKVIFSRSKSHWLMWNLLIEELSLKPQLDFIIDRVAGNAVADKSEYFDQFAIGWWNESDFAYLLAKRIEESKELQLGFLENEELKKLIIEDYAEARRSFHSKNYKATILLCGSVAEAMLTAVVAKAGLHGISIAKLYKDYNLSMLVNVAKEHSLIRDKALFSLLDSIRHYRNIIHPGVQIRKSLAPDSSKASIAIETISLLGKELNKISI